MKPSTKLLDKILVRVFQMSYRLFTAARLPRLAVFVRRSWWRSRLHKLGSDCNIYSKVVIYCPERVIIGKKVSIAEFVHIWGGGGVSIGDQVMIASHSVITSQTHEINPITRRTNVCKPVVIGNNVWIGSGAIILPGVSIGDNSVVAAGSVVTRNVPSDCLVVGMPARISMSLTHEDRGSTEDIV